MRLDLRKADRLSADQEAGADAIVRELAGLSPAQVDAAIDARVIGTAAQQMSALKAITKALAKAIIVLSRAG